MGWILAEKRKARELLKGKWLTSGHNSEYSLWIARQVLRMRSRFVERARKIYSENIGLVRQFIDDTPTVSVRRFGAAPFCLVEYRKGPGSVSLGRRILENTGVIIAPGDFFAAPRAFRLCFTPDRKVLQPGLRRLSNFLNTLPHATRT